jgi:hypothetical protein
MPVYLTCRPVYLFRVGLGLSSYLPACLSVGLSLPVCLSVHLSVSLSVYLRVCLSVGRIVCPSVHPQRHIQIFLPVSTSHRNFCLFDFRHQNLTRTNIQGRKGVPWGAIARRMRWFMGVQDWVTRYKLFYKVALLKFVRPAFLYRPFLPSSHATCQIMQGKNHAELTNLRRRIVRRAGSP